jgi:large subunit ribosomal protein L1
MSKNTKLTKLPGRSKKYSENAKKILAATKNNTLLLDLETGIKLLLDLDQPKFKQGPTLELHFKLNIDPTKSDQIVRNSVNLPHGTGNKVILAAFVTPEKEKEALASGADIVGGDELIEQIKKDEKINFDKAIAQPEMMKKLPAIARILGVAGVMPNPKTGTVGDNIAELIKTFKAGRVDYKNDKSGNLHIIFGKINKEFNLEKLLENANSALDSVQKSKPEAVKKRYISSIHICSTNSPSIKISL